MIYIYISVLELYINHKREKTGIPNAPTKKFRRFFHWFSIDVLDVA